MMHIRNICCIIFLTEIIRFSRSHPDCNQKKVVEKFFYMCNAYSSSSIKRETNSANGFNHPPVNGPPPALSENEQAFQQQQAPPYQYEYPYNPNIEVVPQQEPPHSPELVSTSANLMHPTEEPNKNASREGPASMSVTVQTYSISSHRERLHPVSDPIEPEDFDSFNDYYLNPVYADADWQSSVERWRRNPHIKDAIWSFVRDKCCKTGCPFPDDFWELDKRVNICGMR